jgi:hypothetical protein
VVDLEWHLVLLPRRFCDLSSVAIFNEQAAMRPITVVARA